MWRPLGHAQIGYGHSSRSIVQILPNPGTLTHTTTPMPLIRVIETSSCILIERPLANLRT